MDHRRLTTSLPTVTLPSHSPVSISAKSCVPAFCLSLSQRPLLQQAVDILVSGWCQEPGEGPAGRYRVLFQLSSLISVEHEVLMISTGKGRPACSNLSTTPSLLLYNRDSQIDWRKFAGRLVVSFDGVRPLSMTFK